MKDKLVESMLSKDPSWSPILSESKHKKLQTDNSDCISDFEEEEKTSVAPKRRRRRANREKYRMEKKALYRRFRDYFKRQSYNSDKIKGSNKNFVSFALERCPKLPLLKALATKCKQSMVKDHIKDDKERARKYQPIIGDVCYRFSLEAETNFFNEPELCYAMLWYFHFRGREMPDKKFLTKS